jgi:hypothetical protein
MRSHLKATWSKAPVWADAAIDSDGGFQTIGRLERPGRKLCIVDFPAAATAMPQINRLSPRNTPRLKAASWPNCPAPATIVRHSPRPDQHLRGLRHTVPSPWPVAMPLPPLLPRAEGARRGRGAPARLRRGMGQRLRGGLGQRLQQRSPVGPEPGAAARPDSALPSRPSQRPPGAGHQRDAAAAGAARAHQAGGVTGSPWDYLLLRDRHDTAARRPASGTQRIYEYKIASGSWEHCG